MYIIDLSLQKFIFKEVLEMTGTDTFTVLSMEDLEQASGGRMTWLVDDWIWTSPNSYSLAGEWITISSNMEKYRYGLHSW